MTDSEKCHFVAPGRQISISLEQFHITEKCKTIVPCYLHLRISGGVKDEKFQLGYTFNDVPFQLNKGEIFTAPAPFGTGNALHFIYHPEKGKPCNLYFNSKGRNLEIYSKVIDASVPEKDVSFPQTQDSDFPNEEHTFIQNFFYSAEQMNAFGMNPEILISVVDVSNINREAGFSNS